MTPTGALTDDLSRRLEEARRTPGWHAYQRARSHLLAMKDAERAFGEETTHLSDGPGAPSAYWREELAELEYLVDASPLVVERLRRHTAHVTGLSAYQYRSGTGVGARHLEGKLRALEERGGAGLRVPESPELGGFGYRIDGALYNVDTLKFHEALTALHRAGELDALRAGEPRVVWEIGSGWGGFAYQFKTLFPSVTYVLVDLPELFALSGTYLRTLFPEARLAFVAGEGGTDDPAQVDGAVDADFVFVPPFALERAEVPRPDLTVNMVSFQEMTDEQVRGYVHRAADLGCPALYSLNRSRSPYNRELSSVREIISERYELEEVSVLDVDYTRMLPDGPLARLRAAAGRTVARLGLSSHDPYRHLVGRLPHRLRAPSPANAS